MKRPSTSVIIFTLSFILALLATIYMGVRQTQDTTTTQSLQSEASTPDGTTTLSIENREYFAPPNSVVPVAIKLSTPRTPDNRGIVVVKASLKFPTTSALTLKDSDITTNINELNYLKKEVVVGQQETSINIEAAYMQGSVNGYMGAVNAPQSFAILNFHTGTVTAPTNVDISFNSQNSLIQSKANATDILNSTLNGTTIAVIYDADAPETTISSGPSGIITTNNATFEFTAIDTPTPPPGIANQLTFSYRLDNNSWSEYQLTTSAAFYSLGIGKHRFEVRAKDGYNNIDATPAFREFTYAPPTNLSVKVQMSNMSTLTKHYPQTAKVEIRNSTYNSGLLNTTLNYVSLTGTTPYYEGKLTLPDNFPSNGTYEVLIKSTSRLNRKFSGVVISKSADNLMTRTGTTESLLAGDINDDNTIQIDDIGEIISVWTQSERNISNNPELRPMDLNEDGYISITDIGEIIANWTSTETKGDE